MYSIEITTREWYGVKIPKWLRVFDCRGDDIPRRPNGVAIYSSEKAAYDTGLRTDTEWNDGTPVSMQTHWDSRTAPSEELTRQVTAMVAEAKSLKREYDKALKTPPPPGESGSLFFKVVCVALSNYGWCVLVDQRCQAVRPFKP